MLMTKNTFTTNQLATRSQFQMADGGAPGDFQRRWWRANLLVASGVSGADGKRRASTLKTSLLSHVQVKLPNLMIYVSDQLQQYNLQENVD
jgi:hypothetical protein